MNNILFALATFLFCSISAFADAVVGQAAPEFIGTDSNGKTHTLSEYNGKYVVLEWLNHGCPYVRKHYDTGNMQKLQADYTAKGAVWLSIASSAEGKQGHLNAEETNSKIQEKNSKSTAVVLDASGTIGKLYGAKVTPHMFIINPEGNLIYAGAIDDNSSSRPSSVEGAKNYVSKALEEAISGKVVSEAQTEPYGCSVKYKS
jgi:peroxiredoxin